MSTVVNEHSSWKGLLGCLGTGAVVVGLAVWGVMFVRGRSADKEARIRTEFLEPWVQAVRDGSMAQVWDKLTTEAYRKAKAQATVEGTYRAAVEKFGKVAGVKITSFNGTTELGSGRRSSRTVTRWTWENGQEMLLVFDLVDVPEVGFRVDDARFGPGNHHIALSDVGGGIW